MKYNSIKLIVLFIGIFIYFAQSATISPNLRKKLEKYHQELNQKMNEEETRNENLNWKPETLGTNEKVPFEYIIHVDKNQMMKNIRERLSELNPTSKLQEKLQQLPHHLGVHGLQNQLVFDLHEKLKENKFNEVNILHGLGNLEESDNGSWIDIHAIEIFPNTGIYKVQVLDSFTKRLGLPNISDHVFHSHLKTLDYVDKVSNNELLEYTKR